MLIQLLLNTRTQVLYKLNSYITTNSNDLESFALAITNDKCYH